MTDRTPTRAPAAEAADPVVITPAPTRRRPRGYGGPRWAAVLSPFRGRPPLWKEVVVVVWLLWIYDAINNLTAVRATQAIRHTTEILHFEQGLHLAVERSFNRYVSAHHFLALLISDFYDNAHFVVTFGVLGWLWWARPGRYVRLRRALVVINLIGFAVFLLYPMAPPRMLEGFVDTVAASHAIGSWHSGSLAADADQYAAMPSLHLAWAVWSSVAIWITTDRRWLRALAAAYPVAVAVGVLATANHLLVDSAAGVATAILAVVATGCVGDLRGRLGVFGHGR